MQLEINEAVVFRVPLESSLDALSAAEKLLSADELARANRFLVPDVRRRFVLCRGQLRRRLATLIDIPPTEIRFEYDRWGKPTLQHKLRSPLHFNVSHSGDWALIAVARSPLGIDVEVPSARISPRAIASQILSPDEQIQWKQLPGREWERAVMRLWVCKEALLKAMGLGISEGLQQVSFSLPQLLAMPAVARMDDSPMIETRQFSPTMIAPALQIHLDDEGSCRMNHWIDPAAWRMSMLDVFPEAYAAICTAKQVRFVRL